jgi:hypothetical protein
MTGSRATSRELNKGAPRFVQRIAVMMTISTMQERQRAVFYSSFHCKPPGDIHIARLLVLFWLLAAAS